ncbi:MAG TPA: exonuclease domain-containing protein [Methylophilaceae bacterium]|nr:exonuclease domain-containing protein [Methylophilaceae bacterium]
MLPSYVLLDLETTGATPLRDRITEIALVRFDHGIETARWQTLVNPETPIPPFIQNLTGITDEMVRDAPTFAEVAPLLLDYFEGSVLAAHNARFDHGFLKSEYKRIGISLRQKVLCTVKLSRKLYPEHYRHGLDAIIQRHGLTCSARHRAMGDVEMLIGFLQAASADLGIEQVQATAESLMRGPSLPPGLDHTLLDDLPESPGVYLFYGESPGDSQRQEGQAHAGYELPLYIGKSVNIRSRVLSHFSSDHSSTKEMRITQEIKRVEWRETAGEFGALLLESRLIKEMQPIYNRRLRNERQLCSWRIADTADTRPLVTLVRESEIEATMVGQLFGTFRSKRQAVEVLQQIAENHGLCEKLLGLENGKGPCFAHQLRRCKGVCAGKEAPEIHYLRLQQALAAHRLKTWPYEGRIALREYDSASNQTQIHVFEHWCHLVTASDEATLHESLETRRPLAFDLDTYKLLLKELHRNRLEIIRL